MFNFDQYSDASDSDSDSDDEPRACKKEAQPSKTECPASPHQLVRAASSVAEPAAEPSPIADPSQQEESGPKIVHTPHATEESPDKTMDCSEGEGSESADACSLSAGEPEPEVPEPEVPEAPSVAPEATPDVPLLAVSELLRMRPAAEEGESPIGESYVLGELLAVDAADLPYQLEAPVKSPPSAPVRSGGGAGRKGAGGGAGAGGRRQPRKAPPPAAKPQQSRSEAPTAELRRETTSAREKLLVSQHSWAAQQRARRSDSVELSDGGEAEARDAAEVERKLKSILNKLTLTNFSNLCQQLLDCGVWASSHLELLIAELFEKATTQHHFIDMYADLCVVLHDHFAAKPPAGTDEKFSFKRLLLNACQVSFERHLAPPEGLDQLSQEERTEAEVCYKTKMLGNIRFVGALLVRQILASKVLLAIIAELLSNPTREALEALTALLTVVGPAFDSDEWVHRSKLDAVFDEMQGIASRKSTEPRTRCLLKDVLDMRKRGWKDVRPKQREAPTAQKDSSGCSSKTSSPASPPFRRSGSTAAATTPAPAPTLQSGRVTILARAAATEGSVEAFRAELSKALSELRCSGDWQEATARVVQQPPPPASDQPEELCQMLALVCQESQSSSRKVGFQAAARLFLDGRWRPGGAATGVRAFGEACEDLQHDVPTLSVILQEELLPSLLPLVRRGLMDESVLEALRR